MGDGVRDSGQLKACMLLLVLCVRSHGCSSKISTIIWWTPVIIVCKLIKEKENCKNHSDTSTFYQVTVVAI